VHTFKSIDVKDDKCFLYNKPAGSEGLHNASKYYINVKVHRCVIELEDTVLLAKLEPGDVIALEAKYHQEYPVNLYNRARALESTVSYKSCDVHPRGIAFAEMVVFMENL